MIIGIIIGFIAGTFSGLFIMTMMTVAKENEKHVDDYYKEHPPEDDKPT